jgi:hypothetical protein
MGTITKDTTRRFFGLKRPCKTFERETMKNGDYEEKVIDGILHWRPDQTVNFKPFTKRELTDRAVRSTLALQKLKVERVHFNNYQWSKIIDSLIL